MTNEVQKISEDELIERAKNADNDALIELIRRYEKTVYNFSFKICRNREKAENAMQETFLNVLKSLHQFDGNSKFSTWLYRIILNNCLMDERTNAYKKNLVSIYDEDVNIEEPKNTRWYEQPLETLMNSELKKKLDEAIGNLEPEYKTVYLLRDVEGLSTEETGQVLNLSVPAVKSRLHRARLYLRNELREYFKN